jgi:hypothetical protein
MSICSVSMLSLSVWRVWAARRPWDDLVSNPSAGKGHDTRQ